jgi:hypothetical protein
MAEMKFKAMRAEADPEHAPPRLLTTEAKFDDPKPGDVRIEKAGAPAVSTKRAKNGAVVVPEPGYECYVYGKRPDRHPLYGLYCHKDDGVNYTDILTQTPPAPGGSNPLYGVDKAKIKHDADGFLLGLDGKRIRRFTDDHVWVPFDYESSDGVDEASALERAKAKAQNTEARNRAMRGGKE